jgi:UDP-N-acetylglucosamine 1-carboxyvinyltransferase
MSAGVLVVEPSGPLYGTVELAGAKNAVLVMMISLILARGISRLYNVPNISDVRDMILLLESLGVLIAYCSNTRELVVDTTHIECTMIAHDLMKKTRASILVMGALLARCGVASVGLPGGDAIGKRPIDFHIKGLQKLGADIVHDEGLIHVSADTLRGARIILEYPSVGATENIMLAAVGAEGTTTIVNAALEPEVVELIHVLRLMGVHITVEAPATIRIEGCRPLTPVIHTVMVDRLEAGTLLIAAAVTGGSVYLPTARPDHLDMLLMKLEEMGHSISVDSLKAGIRLVATRTPTAVSFKTGPYPSFPTDLQAPMMAAQCGAQGRSFIEETVFENRLFHAEELIKMGAEIIITNNSKVVVQGSSTLYGTQVTANDIRASSALVIAGLAASGGCTEINGLIHWQRGYEALERKLVQLGASLYTKNVGAEMTVPKVYSGNVLT